MPTSTARGWWEILFRTLLLRSRRAFGQCTMSYLPQPGDEPNGIVMDFFAGSGTTGHAVIQQNADHDRARRYILVQLPEPIEGSDGFATIADLTKARMRAASEKIADENPLFAGDVGLPGLQAGTPPTSALGIRLQTLWTTRCSLASTTSNRDARSRTSSTNCF